MQSLQELRIKVGRLGLSPRLLVFFFFMHILSVVFESMGVAMLLPIFELLREGRSVSEAELTGWHWDAINKVAGFVGVPVSLGMLLAASFGLVLIRQLFTYWLTIREARANRQAADKTRRRAFNGFLYARSEFQEAVSVGDIAANLTFDLPRALSAVFNIVILARKIIQVVVYVAGLLLLSAHMTILSLGLFTAALFFSRSYLGEIKIAGEAIATANAQLTSFMVDRLRLARLVRLSGTETAEGNAFGALSRRHAVETLRQKVIQTRMKLVPEPLALGFSYTMVFVGGEIFGLGLERLAMFVVVLIRLLPLVQGLIKDHTEITGKWPSLEKVDGILNEISEFRELPGGERSFEGLDRSICFEEVSFSYGDDGEPALSGVSAKMPAHKMTALVGPSGAGKSTFVDLLPRLREPTSGRIMFDGTPVIKYSTESLRAGIAFVPQQPQIFDISAAEHIRYGKEDATDDEVRDAAALAGALEFIEALPDGFNTPLGVGGKRLSGGQRQRLDIARALVRRAPILILDEPTSALDADAEAAFRDALQTLRRETELTIIVIAHRLSTIVDSDHIIVLKGGKVDAAGTHEELLSNDNWYARAFAKQVSALAGPAAKFAKSSVVLDP